MPALAYTSTNFPFQPFTKIYSADTNQCLNDIKTLLNTTKLDDTNLQTNGITRNGVTSKLKTGTANYAVINGSDGNMSEEAQLAATRGGTGANLTPASANTDDVLKISGGAFVIGAAPASPPNKVYNFYRFA